MIDRTRLAMMLAFCAACLLAPFTAQAQPAASKSAADLYADDNLTAWLVMFTDSVKRTPDERAEMVANLGFDKVGFESFKKYLPILEEQMDAYAKRGVKVTSVYLVIETQKPSEEEQVKKILDVLKRRGETPQIWAMFSRNSFKNVSDEERMEKLIEAFSDLAKRVDQAGCQLALYNYGSWFGKLDVQLGVIEGVRKQTGIKIGTVFNFHRGHQHMKDFPEALQKMMPHLFAVNLNGMYWKDADYDGGGARILPVGEGDHELTMMRQLAESGYDGPIGIIDHRNGVDAEVALKENLAGLAKLRKDLK
ncbi:MAG: sugar phosphate isomerase/epimerase family protein [Blastopirellula sp. JB062]